MERVSRIVANSTTAPRRGTRYAPRKIMAASGMAESVPPTRGTLLASGSSTKPSEFSRMKLSPAMMAMNTVSFLFIHGTAVGCMVSPSSTSLDSTITTIHKHMGKESCGKPVCPGPLSLHKMNESRKPSQEDQTQGQADQHN